MWVHTSLLLQAVGFNSTRMSQSRTLTNNELCLVFFAVYSSIKPGKFEVTKLKRMPQFVTMCWPHFYALVLSQSVNKNLLVQRMTTQTLQLDVVLAEGSAAYQQIYSKLHARGWIVHRAGRSAGKQEYELKVFCAKHTRNFQEYLILMSNVGVPAACDCGGWVRCL